MKNELPVFFIRKPDYTLFGYVTIYLQWLVMSNLRHLDVVMAKTGLTPCGLDPVFFSSKKPRPQDAVQRDSTQYRLFMIHLLYLVIRIYEI